MLATDLSKNITFQQILELETAYFGACISRLLPLNYSVPNDLNFNQSSLSQWWCTASNSERQERYDLLREAYEIKHNSNQAKNHLMSNSG